MLWLELTPVFYRLRPKTPDEEGAMRARPVLVAAERIVRMENTTIETGTPPEGVTGTTLTFSVVSNEAHGTYMREEFWEPRHEIVWMTGGMGGMLTQNGVYRPRHERIERVRGVSKAFGLPYEWADAAVERYMRQFHRRAAKDKLAGNRYSSMATPSLEEGEIDDGTIRSLADIIAAMRKRPQFQEAEIRAAGADKHFAALDAEIQGRVGEHHASALNEEGTDRHG